MKFKPLYRKVVSSGRPRLKIDAFEIYKLRAKIQKETGKEVSNRILAKELGVSESTIRRRLKGN